MENGLWPPPLSRIELYAQFSWTKRRIRVYSSHSQSWFHYKIPSLKYWCLCSIPILISWVWPGYWDFEKASELIVTCSQDWEPLGYTLSLIHAGTAIIFYLTTDSTVGTLSRQRHILYLIPKIFFRNDKMHLECIHVQCHLDISNIHLEFVFFFLH